MKSLLLTRKGIISTIIGVSIALIGSIFHFTLMYLLIDNYGTKFNGFIQHVVVLVSFLGGAEGALGIMTVIFLMKPLAKKDWFRANELINITRRQNIIKGIISLIILFLIAFIYLVYLRFTNNPVEFKELTGNARNANLIELDQWKILLVMFGLGFKNLIALFWVGVYENLLQADQNNYIRRLATMIADLLVYSALFYCISIKLDPFIPFLFFFVYSIIKSTLIYLFVRIKYPWLRIKKTKIDMQFLKSSRGITLYKIGESLLLNSDILLISVILGFNTTSVLSVYLTISLWARTIMITFVTSFREFFASWIAKDGRIYWESYSKFETYAFMIAAFTFVNQFIFSPYFINALYYNQFADRFKDWTEGEMQIFKATFFSPTLSLLVALSSAFLIISEPMQTLIYAKAYYKETAKAQFVFGILNIIVCTIVGISLSFSNSSSKNLDTLYGIFIVSLIFKFLRYIYLWVFSWIYLTYGSSFKNIGKNILILLIPLISVILLNYLYIWTTDGWQIVFDATNLTSSIDTWGWKKLLNFFLIVASLSGLAIFAVSLAVAPASVLGILRRLPIINRTWDTKKTKERYKRYKDNEQYLVDLKEPTNAYEKQWEREEKIKEKTRELNLGEVDNIFNDKEVYIIKGT